MCEYHCTKTGGEEMGVVLAEGMCPPQPVGGALVLHVMVSAGGPSGDL